MGFVFGLVGALAGAWMMSEGRTFFGLIAGMTLGWLLQRLIAAQTTIRQLSNRVDQLERRNQATAAEDKVAKRPLETPARVSVYEPSPAATPPPPAPPPAPKAAAAGESPEVIVHEPPPAPKPRPGIGEHTFEVAKRWLTTGNVPVKVGVIISFFGVAFLLKYAAENALFRIPIGVRYLGIAGFAAAMLGFGWQKRGDNRVFALSIQGGGIGVLYLTIFAAFRLHGLLPPGVAFFLLVLMTAGTGYIAIRQESRALAILGTAGGFLAPLLASTGSGNHVGLFSYYLVLNCAILGLAWYRPWRELNIIGFVFTFGVGTIWGYQYYRPELFATTEPFLVLYFLFYTAIAVLFAFRQRPELRGYVDGTLLFGTPTIAFALQSQLVDNTEYGLAISAAMVAIGYAATAAWLHRTQNENFKLLTQAFVALAVAFGTIAVPLALDDRFTALAWALEGAALVWIGVRQNTTLAKITGAALSFAAGAEFLNYGWVNDLGLPVLNGNFAGCVLIAIAAMYSAYQLREDKDGRDWQQVASLGLLFWGLSWWFGAGLVEIDDRVRGDAEWHWTLLFVSLSFAALAWAGSRLRWIACSRTSLSFLPALIVLSFAYLWEFHHFFEAYGILLWPLALAAHGWILMVYRDGATIGESIAHGAGAVFFALLLAFEIGWQIDEWVVNDIWAATGAFLALAVAASLTLFDRCAVVWPLTAHRRSYVVAGLLLLGLYILMVSGIVLSKPGSPRPLPYIPILNPFDILSIVAVAMVWLTTRTAAARELLRIEAGSHTPLHVLGAVALLLSTLSIVRIVHHVTGVPWYSSTLFDSVAVQSSLSIYWAILGLTGMVLGARQVRRSVWMIGAAMMGVVVLKLFVVDLGNTGTVARIISFLGVGVMLLVVGYFSPVPPKPQKSEA